MTESHSMSTIEKPSPLRRRRGRRWRFRLLAVLFAMACFPLVEVSLQLLDLGPDVGLVVAAKTSTDSAEYTHETNETLDKAYYGVTDLSGPERRPFILPKPPKTFRIAVLGGSTVIGFPYDSALSFPRQIEVQLGRQLPDRTVEVFNLGITAINSFAIADIVVQATELQPDLIIVHTGHNEFYGPGGPASRASNLPPLLIRSVFRCRRLRSVQLLSSLVVGNSTANSDLMTVLPKQLEIPIGGEIYTQAASNLRGNLREIVATARNAEIPVLLTSVASNLKDQSPLYSGLPNRSAREELTWKELVDEAGVLIKDDKCERALEQLDEAAKITEDHAAFHFRRGHCYLQLGQLDQAWESLTKARDLDMCRFRMSSDFLEITREVAEDENVAFVDVGAEFRRHGHTAPPGFDLFHEHVHYNSRGHWLLGKILAKSVMEQFIEKDWSDEITVSYADIDAAIGMIPEDRLAAISFSIRVHETGPFQKSLDRTKHIAALGKMAAAIYEALPEARQSAFADLPVEKMAQNLLGHLATAVGDLDQAFTLKCREYQAIRQPWSQ